MAEDHFTLDVDVDSLRAAQRWLETLAEHVRDEGRAMGRVPDDLGAAWQGPASVKIKGEMRAMATTVGRFAPEIRAVRDEVRSFADAVETFRTTTLVDCNNRWNRAQQEASDDIAAAEGRLEGEALGARRGEIANGLRYTLQGIDHHFRQEKQALATKARRLGSVLAGSSPVAVPDSVATRFVSGGGSGTRIRWTDGEGDFPPDLDANASLGGMTLSEDADQQEAGEDAAEALAALDDPRDYQDYLDSLDAGSEAFRQAFLDHLDPSVLASLHRTVSAIPDHEQGGALLTALAEILAGGSRQGYGSGSAYPVSSTVYDEVVEAYTDIDDDHDPHAQAKGYLRLSELVAAGQGRPPTWDSEFLADVTRTTIAFEREQVRNDEYWSWGPAGGELSWNTARGSDWYGDRGDTDNPYWADPLVLYFEAMADDTAAAQGVFTNGGDALDQELSEYLYGRHAGHAGNYGWALSQALQSATEPVGPGGEGTPDHVSAEIVADLVGHYADHDLGLNMEQGIVDILTNHVHAVNHATDEDTGYQGLVVEANANSNYPHEWVTKANLTQEDLDRLLTNVFGLDYYSNQIAEDRDPPVHEFPLYTQLALAMELAARDEVHHVAQHGDPGQLERLVNELSSSQQRTLNAFTAALEAEGREGDERNADARAALDFVLGMAKEAVPTERLGPADALVGPGLDQVQGLLVDALIPETSYEAAASEDASVEEYRRQLTSLKLVAWLDEAGTLPEQNSPQKWAEENPDFAAFLEDGELVDPASLYRNREENPEAWNDFVRYHENSGSAWLAHIDLDEQYTLGWLEAGG